ncbi:hypothetical protein BJ684DRAFT_12547 [Piptocephalis cylindrospora]|uniref:Transmembrane protein 135 N-terminal domain-containing protein n=1 Tax=Piptocephalis cylindrospora TaxID=1907219 RepID=A0A4P9XZC6_9FUNG|nr:hypothetical protein BJ684DRAFT_12547 [Piptocephalis cylindrospora]|eukprot:RKP11724.1 hypothetical protein BJ684DRAFT_12547 [Piptocephalis cylindrospora]
MRHKYIGCALEHPWTSSCVKAHTGTWVKAYGRSLRLYIPLNVLMTLVFRWKHIKTSPKKVLIQLIKSCLRSACFLATYVTVAWVVPCVMRRALGAEYLFSYRINGILSGCCALIDPPGRRLELAMYCLPRALESLWKCWERDGWVRGVRHGEVAYFSVAMGFLMWLYQCQPESIDDSYRGVMTRFFGRN